MSPECGPDRPGEGGPAKNAVGDTFDADRTALVIALAAVPERARLASLDGVHPDVRAAILDGVDEIVTRAVAVLVEAVES